MSLLSDILTTLDRWGEWKRMREAPARIDELERKLAQLEGKRLGEICRSCGAPSARLTGSQPDAMFGAVGGNRETWTCESCGFAEEKLK